MGGGLSLGFGLGGGAAGLLLIGCKGLFLRAAGGGVLGSECLFLGAAGGRVFVGKGLLLGSKGLLPCGEGLLFGAAGLSFAGGNRLFLCAPVLFGKGGNGAGSGFLLAFGFFFGGLLLGEKSGLFGCFPFALFLLDDFSEPLFFAFVKLCNDFQGGLAIGDQEVGVYFLGVARIGATAGMGRDAIAVWTGGVGRGWARKGVSLGAATAASEDSAREGEEMTWTTLSGLRSSGWTKAAKAAASIPTPTNPKKRERAKRPL